MKKAGKALRALGLIVRHPWLLNHVLDEEMYWKKKVKREFGFSSGLPVIDLTSLFGDVFSVTVGPLALQDGGSTPADLALLKGLAVKYQVQRYLEIGTWRGESVANVAPVVPECVTLNLPDETMRARGLPEDYIAAHRHFSKHLPNVTHLQADSTRFDFSSLEQPFGLVFVDGDHHAPVVASDTANVFRVTDPLKGMIVWHDYAVNPEKIRWSVLYGILKGCPHMHHHRLFHVANTMCALFLPQSAGPVFSSFLKPNAPLQKHFLVTLKVVKN